MEKVHEKLELHQTFYLGGKSDILAASAKIVTV